MNKNTIKLDKAKPLGIMDFKKQQKLKIEKPRLLI